MLFVDKASPGYAQIGYWKGTATGGLTRHYWQYRNAVTAVVTSDWDFGHVLDGSTYNYKVEYKPNGCGGASNPKCVRMYIDNALIMSTDFDAATNWGSSVDWGMEYAEGAQRQGSNVAGTPSSTVRVANMSFLTNQIVWAPVDCDLINYHNDDPSHWGHNFPSCATQDLYTDLPY